MDVIMLIVIELWNFLFSFERKGNWSVEFEGSMKKLGESDERNISINFFGETNFSLWGLLEPIG